MPKLPSASPLSTSSLVPAERGELEVVDRRGAVERDVGDDAARDQRAHERPEPDLHDVPAEQQDDPVASARGARPRRR